MPGFALLESCKGVCTWRDRHLFKDALQQDGLLGHQQPHFSWYVYTIYHLWMIYSKLKSICCHLLVEYSLVSDATAHNFGCLAHARS